MRGSVAALVEPGIVAVFCVAVFAAVALISMLAVPSGAQLRKPCAAHGGVLSVTQPLLGPDVVVCRDGWAGYP